MAVNSAQAPRTLPALWTYLQRLFAGQQAVTQVTFPNGVFIRSGTGDPTGKVKAIRGSVWLRQDGGASTSLYVKESGDGLTSGWQPK